MAIEKLNFNLFAKMSKEMREFSEWLTMQVKPKRTSPKISAKLKDRER